MKNIVHVTLAALLILCAVIPGKAEKYHFEDQGKGQRAQTAAGCTPSSALATVSAVVPILLRSLHLQYHW